MDLRELFEHRRGETVFKERDVATKIFENYYQSRDPQKPGVPQLTYRPYLVDNVSAASDDNRRYAVNLSRRVISYFGSLFAQPPAIWKSALGDDQKSADLHTAWLQHVLLQSRIKTLQPRQSHWLSLRGDAVYHVDWDEEKIRLRTYDPSWCYPAFSNLDIGKVEDILIVFQTSTRWANQHYGTNEQGDSAYVYIYWDEYQAQTQINRTRIPALDRNHDLGMCPFRWIFGSPDGTLAQSDIRDIPSLQDLYNENLLLALDSIRKNVDPAYWGTGFKGNLTPESGTVLAIPNEAATINRFDAGGDAPMIMGVMSMLNQNVEATSGISPISSSGRAQGSIVTGTAVRNQVEAIEARVETRRAAFEDTFSQLGATCFEVLEKIFPKHEQTFPTKAGEQTLKGVEVNGWYDCQAQYGEYFSLDPQMRVQAALSGLGRIWDDKMAIRLAKLPDTTPEEMSARIADYQERQAITTGRAQALSQLAGQTAGQQAKPEDVGGQPSPGPPAGSLPQPASPAPAPGMAQLNVSIQDVQRALALIKPQLRGPVWATADLAVVGMSSNPMVVVGLERDLPIVNSVMQSLHGIALPDSGVHQPRLELA
jgi:hypothetical protein